MEQREIEIFLTLADELHFGRAAAAAARVDRAGEPDDQEARTAYRRTAVRAHQPRRGDPPRTSAFATSSGPAYQQIRAAVDAAVAAGHGTSETLRVGFIGAASGRFVLEVAQVFRTEYPDCAVTLVENQFGWRPRSPPRPRDRHGARHRAAPRCAPGGAHRRERAAQGGPAPSRVGTPPVRPAYSVSFSDVARTTILRTPPAISDYWDQTLIPQRTPDGRPVERGPTFGTSQEMLSLVGTGVGSYPVSAQFTSYYARPDVAYVPIHDAPPYQRRFLWCSAAKTTTIRAFDRVAVALARAHTA